MMGLLQCFADYKLYYLDIQQSFPKFLYNVCTINYCTSEWMSAISHSHGKGVNMFDLDDQYYYILHIQSCVSQPLCVGWGLEDAIQGGIDVLYISLGYNGLNYWFGAISSLCINLR